MEFVNLATAAVSELVSGDPAVLMYALQGVTMLGLVGFVWALSRKVDGIAWQCHWMDGRLDMHEEEAVRIRDQVAKHEKMLQHMAAMRAAKAEKAKVA
jgi:hypothetical protein